MPAPSRSRASITLKGNAPAPTPEPVDMSKIQLAIEYVDITDIQPYAFNARDNAKAVDSLVNSIKAFGFVVPVVIDADGVLGAGHTRVEAAKVLGMLQVPAVRADHMTPEQMNAFRLVDNKVAEIADWDFALLAQEIQALEGLYDMTEFGWTDQEIDCLSSMVNDDCLNTAGLGTTAIQTPASEARNQLRSPTRARIVIGEFVLWVPAEEYRNWANGLRALHDFDGPLIEEEIKRRLGFSGA